MRQLASSVALLALVPALPLHAQQSQQSQPSEPLFPNAPSYPSQTPDPASDPQALHAEGDREVKAQEQQRILAVVPNFNTVLSGRGVALSKGQKIELAFHAAADPFNIVGSFFLAGYSELGDTHRGYGWGPQGYFKRAGANYADTLDGTMLAGAVYPIFLHQDPRFFRQGNGSIKSRLRHALTAPLICRGDNGRTQPNLSNVLGNLTAGAISNVYYPAQDRGASLTLVNSSIVTLEGGLGNIGLEFAPDVSAWWHRRHAPKDALPPEPAPADAPTLQSS